ncbi:MAG: GtrA family protein [Patescibacteria group bacterium]|nr:GtrA family protein [Patescibacteria group bacterium]MDE1943989.1 GtrA family protein [Patescibacteria group bacterium]MDE1945059.1 GtrA family protein [Patescibacteria group bacterium]MDE2057703.1 GtrA family protein [Patescibacteria group bacterium]
MAPSSALTRFASFACIGGAGFVVNITITYLLTEYLGWWYLASYVLATVASWTLVFLANSRITFAGHEKDNYARRYSVFMLGYTAVFAGNAALVYLLTSILHVYYLLSITGVTVSLTFVTFLFTRRYVYGVPPGRAPHPRAVLLGSFLLLAVLAPALMSPNPFGNAPDSIGDESYFLTSSFHALEKHTLPGWEFSPNGSYYGGVETYLDLAILVPVLGAVVLATHSVAAAELFVALHTGDILHLMRLASGLLALVLIGACIYVFSRTRAPRTLVAQLALLLFLICGSSLFVGLAHTAKVWVIAVLLDVGAGVLVLANEQYAALRGAPLLARGRMAAVLLWAGVAAFAQTFVGVFSIGLWALYALWLGQVTFADLIAHVRRYWYLFLLAFSLQISFLWRALFVRAHDSIVDFAGNSPYTSGSIDWFHRLYDPLVYAVGSQPLVLLYPVGVAGALWFAARHAWLGDRPRTRRYLIIACVHPALVFLFYHGLVGFSLFPRYAVMLMVAASFSVVMLVGLYPALRNVVLAVACALFLAVSVHSIELYWRPSSTVVLEHTLAASYNVPSNTFVIDHSAWRLALPMNAGSLQALDDARKQMGRFSYLLAHLDQVRSAVTFAPLVLYADTPEERRTELATQAATRTFWIISTDCSQPCAAAETAAGSCFEFNMRACGTVPQEPDTLAVFFRARELGDAYIVRRERRP